MAEEGWEGLYQGGEWQSKIRRGVGGGGVNIFRPSPHGRLYLQIRRGWKDDHEIRNVNSP